MSKKSKSKVGATSAEWNPLDWKLLIELKPGLQNILDLSNEYSREELFKVLAQKLDSDSAPSDHQARELANRWCNIAFKNIDLISFGPKTTKNISIIERYKTFFIVQYELLAPNPSSVRMLERINKARSMLGLTRLKVTDQAYKACTPALASPSAKLAKVANSSTGTKAKANGTVSQAQQLPVCAEALSMPESGEVAGCFQDTQAILTPDHVAEKDLEDKTKEQHALDTSHIELEPLSPGTPSLVGGSSLHSGHSELVTPSTAISELPKTSEKAPKNTRRPGRGEKSRLQHNKKKIPTINGSGVPETAAHVGENVSRSGANHPEKRKQRKKNPAKSLKKRKRRVQLLPLKARLMRITTKNRKANYSESGLSAVDETEPATEANNEDKNALQLDLGPKAPAEPSDTPRTLFGLEAASLKPLSIICPGTPHKHTSSQLGCPLSPTLGPLNEVACTSKTQTPVHPRLCSPPTTSRAGKLPDLPPISPFSSPSPQTNSHVASATYPLEHPSSPAPGIELQPGTVPPPVASIEAATDAIHSGIRIPVWAVSRQELCELPYFKSMQGGVYSRAHTVYGYLLGRFPSPRDAWCHDGRLIISHGGGKNMMNEDQIQPDDSAQSRHQLGDDQLETDASIRGLLKSYRMFRPIVLIAEADYEHLRKFGLKRGHAKEANYYVLGHYAIIAAWAEKEEIVTQGESSSYTRWKFAFQWIEQDQGPPWWLQTSAVSLYSPGFPPQTEKYETNNHRCMFDRKIKLRAFNSPEVVLNPYPSWGAENKCLVCYTISPKVYQTQWVCLNPDCECFWSFDDETISRGELVFDEDFLSLRELPEQIKKIPYSIIPEYPSWENQANHSIFNRHFWVGVCCHECGRVSCRQKWQIWECPTCGEKKQESRPQIYPSSTLDDPLSWENYGNGRFNPTELTVTSRVIKYLNDEHRMAIYYTLPGNIGQIVHVLNNPAASQTANELFEQYQKDACEQDMFQRHAIKTHGVKGELYAQHFSFNAGAPYKYIAEAVSTPFSECPDSVNKAVSHIHDLCEGALGERTEFNELLSVAYAEGQEMNFHSDDEPGLGPIVAGLTLGSSAEMMFRPNVSMKKNQIYKNGPYRASESLTIDAENERVLHITLSHGDLLIMAGNAIQTQYEHAVFVRDTDLVRFAATARLIGASVDYSNSTHSCGQQAKHEIDHCVVDDNMPTALRLGHPNNVSPILPTSPIMHQDPNVIPS